MQFGAFSTSQPILGKRDKRPTIRVPSKKAAAAKARRKAAITAAEDAKAEKLTLADAVSVLRVCFRQYFFQLLSDAHLRLLKLPLQTIPTSYSLKQRLNQELQCLKDA